MNNFNITLIFISILISLFPEISQGQVEERMENKSLILKDNPIEQQILRKAIYLEELKVRWKKAALLNCPGVPCVSAPGSPTSVTATAGNAQASVTFTAPSSNGGSAITSYTVTSNPGNITATGSSSPITVSGLTNGTSYTFTVVATNGVGNSAPSTASSAVTPNACGSITSVSDVDGNSYPTVAIGNQCWMQENLRVTKYNDGVTPIPDETLNSSWGTLQTGARTDYTGATGIPSGQTYISTYGYLYNWYAAVGIITNPGSPTKNICPTGWHVPTDAEWTTLETFLGGSSVAGGKMKSTGTTYWNTPNSGADNSSGFTALPGGWRNSSGSFGNVRNIAFFWSATDNAGYPWYRNLDVGYGILYRFNYYIKSVGASVRCLRD